MVLQKQEIPLHKTPYRDTESTPEKSQGEIRRMLAKYGIQDIQFTHHGQTKLVMRMGVDAGDGHMNAYALDVPFLTTDTKGERQAWRMLFWWLKAKLETLMFSFTDFETEMLPYRLVAGENGPITVAQSILPQLRAGGTDIDPFRPALPEGKR